MLGVGTGILLGSVVAIPVLAIIAGPLLWLLKALPWTRPLAELAASFFTNNMGLIIMSILMIPFMAFGEAWLLRAWKRNRILAWSQAVSGTLLGFPAYVLFSTRLNPFWQ